MFGDNGAHDWVEPPKKPRQPRQKKPCAECAALRQRHAAEVEAAYREGIGYILSKVWDVERIHAAWLASEAKKGLI